MFLRAIVKQRLAHSFRYVGMRVPGAEVTPLVSPRIFLEAMVDKELPAVPAPSRWGGWSRTMKYPRPSASEYW